MNGTHRHSPSDLVRRIVSGGQTGADRAALDVAIGVGIPYAGWCPRGGLAEDHDVPPGLLRDYPELRETPSADAAVRTEWNVRDSEATLLLTRSPGTLSGGSALTRDLAELLGRPLLVSSPDQAASVREWLQRLRAGAGHPPVLNVAGPRESREPGLYLAACRFLEQVVGPKS